MASELIDAHMRILRHSMTGCLTELFRLGELHRRLEADDVTCFEDVGVSERVAVALLWALAYDLRAVSNLVDDADLELWDHVEVWEGRAGVVEIAVSRIEAGGPERLALGRWLQDVLRVWRRQPFEVDSVDEGCEEFLSFGEVAAEEETDVTDEA